MFKQSTDLMPVTLLMSYLLLFIVFVTLMVVCIALQEPTDAEYYYQDTEEIN